ncbi:MAG TPA: flagellar export protein FliJ [Thermotogota bacterium]|nr:flagellar export protein FliJ [Thermotogota bacterium]HRW34586.1 flagellar export protein FliJ [Thermotogota bacterium]
MKRFKFRLDRVLDIFIKRLDQQRMNVHRAQMKRDTKEVEIIEFKHHIVEQENRFSYLMQSMKISPRECVSWENYIDYEYIHLEQYKSELKQLEKQLEEEKRKYIAIDKECKTLNKLKEKKKTAFYLEQDLTERKEMDEIAIQRIFKKANTEGGF